MDKLSSRLDNGFKEIKIESSGMSDRYELKQLGSMARDQFLLDKQTGYVWQLAKDTKTGDLFFYN